MPARVYSVGRDWPGDVAEYVPFRSDKSLFDADVVIFWPTFQDYDGNEEYNGKRILSHTDSSRATLDCAHWRSEIQAAAEEGKVVFVSLLKPADVFVYTGEKTFSGTGRSRTTTHNVDAASSYDSIPIRLARLVPRGGKHITVVGDLGPLVVYWNEFGPSCEYQVYFDNDGVTPLLATKRKEKTVGAIVRFSSGGAIVLLPPVLWDEDALTYTRGESTYWRKVATAFGHRLLNALVAASDEIRRQSKRTPTPEWALAPGYVLPTESRLQVDANTVESEIAKLLSRQEEIKKHIEDAAELRGLLFESGKPLEAVILNVLRLFGFDAGNYRESDSEFDAVFTSAEGRFLGEAEGKEKKAINIDKMSQLERNIQEDFARDEVTEHAKGVLFGNAFRLTPAETRGEFFTTKCVSAAMRIAAALIRTPDLFSPAKYLSDNEDEEYAAACRRAIFSANGTVVAFPVPPDATEV